MACRVYGKVPFEYLARENPVAASLLHSAKPWQVISKEQVEHIHLDAFWRSALEVVVENERNAFIDIDKASIFQDLIAQKWDSFACRYHIYNEILPYAIFVAIFTAAHLYRVAAVWEVHVRYSEFIDNFRKEIPNNCEEET